jgi:hypothetical protein
MSERVKQLAADFEQFVQHDRAGFDERRQQSIAARLCRWDGQTADGRKHYSTVRGQGPFPWEGATDLRLPLVDRVLREDAALLVNALNPTNLRVLPVEAGDLQLAERLTAFARWLLFSDQTTFHREASYLADLLLEDGVALAMVYWDRRTRVTKRWVTLTDVESALALAREADLEGMPVEAQGTLGLMEWFVQMLRDPNQEEAAARTLQAMYADSPMGLRQWRRAVRELAEHNATEIATQQVVRDQPGLRALAFNQDVFLPPGCEEVEAADVIFLQEWFTRDGLERAARERGYDSGWVSEVAKRGAAESAKWTARRRDWREASWLATGGEHVPSYRVVTAVQRTNEDGYPLTRITVFSPEAVEAGVAMEEEVDEPDGAPAFVLWTLEARTRVPEQSRGLPELVWSLQNQIKRMRDLQCDRSDLAILPPWYHPPGQRPAAFGPGVAIGTAQPDMYGFFKGPQMDFASDKLVSELQEEMLALCGRLRRDGTNQLEVMAARQALVTRWLVGWRRVVELMVRMARRYAPERLVGRVLGTNQGLPLVVRREDMQVEFDVAFQWDPAVSDLEYKKLRLEMLRALLDYDVLGRVDRSELTQVAAEIIDPSLAERLLRPAQAASLQEVDEEKAVLGRLLVGIGEDVREGQNHALRLQALEQLLQQPTVMEQLQRNPSAAALVQRRLEQLRHQVTQRQNALTGRLGSAPMETAPAAA